MNQRRTYQHLSAGESTTLANGSTYTADKPGIYVLLENGSVLGPYRDYDAAEQAADETVNSWLMLAR
jgi:hypothetical protein